MICDVRASQTLQVRAHDAVLEPDKPPEPISFADYRIRQKHVLGGLTHEYYIAALPPRVATEKRRSLPESYFRSPQARQGRTFGLGFGVNAVTWELSISFLIVSA